LDLQKVGYTYALNNPLLYTDPSGWEPEHETREPVSPMPYLTEYVHPYDDWGRDWFSNAAYDPYESFARAFYTGVRQRNREAGPTFDDLFVRGADGDWYRRDWLADQLANAPTLTGEGASILFAALTGNTDYLARNTIQQKNYFTDYYSDQDAWDYRLTAFDGPGISVGLSTDVNVTLGAIGGTFELGDIFSFPGNYHSYAYTRGFEYSGSINLVIIWKGKNFTINDFYGYSSELDINVGRFSFAAGTNHTHNVFDGRNKYTGSYGVFKFGFGFGKGASISINSKTQRNYFFYGSPSPGRVYWNPTWR
jgi:hypothetical protein